MSGSEKLGVLGHEHRADSIYGKEQAAPLICAKLA